MSFEHLVARLEQQTFPPVASWSPELTGDMDLVVTAQGEWIHEGTVIKRAGLVKLLAGVLRREEADYFLVTPVEKYRITVDDAPFVVVEVDRRVEANSQSFIFRTNVDDLVKLDSDHGLWCDIDSVTGEPRPYLHVRDGLNALVNRNVFYQLVECVSEQTIDGRVRNGIACGSDFYPLD